VYEQEMLAVLSAARVTHVVFGDLFLADIRAYREQLLARIGLQCEFPLWQRDTHALAREMIDVGLRATLTCVDLAKLDAAFAGRAFDAALLADLPAHVDPCGENGEFHSFVTAGPMLERSIDVRVGETVLRDGFAFADLAPA
jgi:diphthamide synthase (EF-2-diphthine--ammonia ligase)